MIPFLFTVIIFEMGLIMVLLFKTPLRKLMLMGLDQVKRGHGPLMVKTVAGTVLIVLISSLYSMKKIHSRTIGDVINPTDQVLMAKHLLEATLMGASQFLVIMIDRLHHYIKELRIRRKSMEAVKKQSRVFYDKNAGQVEEIRALEEESSTLRAKLKKLESELETKVEDVKAAETNSVALRKQAEGFLLEYDRLLKENQDLRTKLQSLDRTLSHLGGKKNS